MRHWLIGMFLLLSALFVSAAPAWAGFCSAESARPGPRHDLQFVAGYSPGSATLLGTSTGYRFFMAGVGYSYRCWAWPAVSLSYTGELIPAAILFEPGQYLPLFVPAHSVYSFGVTPVGITADFGRRRRVYPFLQIDGGIIASTQPIPRNVVGATGLNFLVDFGGGIRIKTGDRSALSFGYKLLHISNASTTPVNPGLDNNVFYAAYSIQR